MQWRTFFASVFLSSLELIHTKVMGLLPLRSRGAPGEIGKRTPESWYGICPPTRNARSEPSDICEELHAWGTRPPVAVIRVPFAVVTCIIIIIQGLGFEGLG